MKKLIALVLALAMVLMVGAAFATDPAPAADSADWTGTLDTSISVSGLTEGDVVNFYKILAYDQNARAAVADATSAATGAGSWKAIAPFDAMTLADFKAILSTGITYEIAGRLANLITTSTAAKYANVTANASGVASQSDPAPEAGLYIAIITPAANTDNTYNPVFVGADYYDNDDPNHANGWTVTAAMSYGGNVMAKKSTVTLEKTAVASDSNDANTSETVKVGDTITFTVTTKIPGFADNYTSPVFKLSDLMSTGLTYTANSVTVTAPSGLTKGTQYTVNETKSTNGGYDYVLSFSADYLKTVKAATDVTVTYTAVVNSQALESVNPEDNTVKLNYSNSPTDTEGHGVKKDKTNHYSFDIDAKLFGEENYEATEVVKIGLDKQGNEITQTVQLANEHWVGALQGAEFKLYKSNATGTAKVDTVYTNKYYNADSVFVSDAKGTLKLKNTDIEGIRGLDAGVYWLEETKAPDGYIKLQNPVKIEIIPVINEVEYTETVDNVDVTYKANELISYSVKIGGVETANYTMVNNTQLGTHPHIKASKGDTVVGGSDSSDGHPSTDRKGKLENTQGTELPSTGGIGTTLFYVIGGLLVIGAAVVLVARRKASN